MILLSGTARKDKSSGRSRLLSVTLSPTSYGTWEDKSLLHDQLCYCAASCWAISNKSYAGKSCQWFIFTVICPIHKWDSSKFIQEDVLRILRGTALIVLKALIVFWIMDVILFILTGTSSPWCSYTLGQPVWASCEVVIFCCWMGSQYPILHRDTTYRPGELATLLLEWSFHSEHRPVLSACLRFVNTFGCLPTVSRNFKWCKVSVNIDCQAA